MKLTDEQVDALIDAIELSAKECASQRVVFRAIFRAGMLEAARIAEGLPALCVFGLSPREPTVGDAVRAIRAAASADSRGNQREQT